MLKRLVTDGNLQAMAMGLLYRLSTGTVNLLPWESWDNRLLGIAGQGKERPIDLGTIPLSWISDGLRS